MGNLLLRTCVQSARVAQRRVMSMSETLYLAAGPEPSPVMVPDFLVMGAMKAGTTSLHNCLAQHPDLFMTYIKEPSYFLNHASRLAYFPIESEGKLHKLMFKGYRNQRRIGESSTTYTEAPTVGVEAPGNIYREAPRMQFIYILRNPLSRIVSHFLHCMQRGIYQEPISAAVEKDSTFLERSLYFSQLQRYLHYFPREQFQLLFFEDFVRCPRLQLQKVCQFLGVDDLPIQMPVPVSNRTVVDPNVRIRNARFEPDLYAHLVRLIRDDLGELEAFLGQRISLWDLSKEKWCLPAI